MANNFVSYSYILASECSRAENFIGYIYFGPRKLWSQDARTIFFQYKVGTIYILIN